MQCNQARKLMDRYLSEELSLADRVSFEAHLGGCQNCQQQMANLRRLVTTLQCEPAPSVPEDFVARLMNRARQERQAARPLSAVGRTFQAGWVDANAAHLVNAIAAVAAGLLIGIVLGQQSWEHSSQSPDRPTVDRDADMIDSLDCLSGYADTTMTQSYLSLTHRVNSGDI